jgi:hypothetical protein
MEISYENNESDSIAFMRHHLATDPDFNKRRILNLYVYPIVIFVAISVFAVVNKDFAAVIGGIVGALIAYTWNWWGYRRYDRKLVKHIQSRVIKEVHCIHTVTINAEGFTEKTAESQNFQTWNAITRVVFTPEYIYVYNSPITAHTIPLRELGETVFQQVAADIRKYRNA